MWPFYVGLCLLSTAGLSFEIALTRVFSLAQWYHFAFMAVSVALLGFGASGSVLSLFPPPRDPIRLHRYAVHAAVLFSGGVLVSLFTINFLPFDSYRIAWERQQLLYLAIYYLSLALPFFFSGLVVGALLAAQPARASTIYASNLAGSALGCLAAVAALPLLGGAGTVMLSALLGILAAGASALHAPRFTLYLVSLAILSFLTLSPPSFLDIRLSPYKGLSYALQYPGAEIVFSRWNAFSRIDVVRSGGIHSAPGLSLAYLGSPPPQLGLFTDGENLSPITATDWDEADLREFIGYLPTSLPYRLLPEAEVLVIEPQGGLDVLTALENVELVAELVGRKGEAQRCLEQVGLADRANHFPSELSGGEQQRVAIARALVKEPDLLLADEPTGNLDYETALRVLRVMRDINREDGKTVLVVTHNSAIARMADVVIRLRSGEVAETLRNEHPLEPEELRW